MRPPILYISGPYSAGHGRTSEENIDIARAYAATAWERGWAAFCPHLNTAGFERLCEGMSWEDWIAGDLAILDLLDPGVDAVLMLPGWEKSRGATVERQRAVVRGLEIFDPPVHPGCVPPAGGRGLCPHYRQVHYESDSRDTCGSPGMQCPDGKTCPIRRRCR